MPELPEITLFRDFARETSLNKKIKKLEFTDSGSLLQSSQAAFKKALIGEKFETAERLGKYLALQTKGTSALIFHFGMTGKLEYYANQDPPKYTKMIIWFEDDYRLAYTCSRKLGKIFLADNLEKFQEEQELGKDALDVSENDFLEIFEGKTGSIKGVLMDQQEIAGIGNLYSDEMLYQCKIHPKSKTNKISEAKKKQLYKKMKSILEMVIKKESIRKNLPKSYLIHQREDGADCPNCEGKVKKIKVSGRSTYFCPSCQKEEK